MQRQNPLAFTRFLAAIVNFVTMVNDAQMARTTVPDYFDGMEILPFSEILN
ncbi:MAG: hypothetical protein OXO49_04155 [Gammaproteobacteria bacterium]|nr:hypothetical protein [Gammaproteobacteria bacterium]MDE0252178.1 hypothetical protein [Gammaproteobacteria bacterium]MDE0402713.1 hypothetical protein [Gammaproteobacteria bacterium]MDE0646193.1 hypothetical protein [Gammaproteobacteria bacterium]